jgi:hypothetical protein
MASLTPNRLPGLNGLENKLSSKEEFSYTSPLRTVHVLINYGEVLSMLEQFAGEDQKCLNKELAEILSLMIQSYFSRYCVVLQEPTDQRMYRLLEENSFADFDNSEIALQLTLAIIKITQTFLPGFNSHDQRDCSAIVDIKVRDRAVVEVEVDKTSFDRFATQRSASYE